MSEIPTTSSGRFQTITAYSSSNEQILSVRLINRFLKFKLYGKLINEKHYMNLHSFHKANKQKWVN